MKFHLTDSSYSKLHFVGAVFTLVGTIIGAGVLGIPYVVAKAGYLTGLVVMLLLSVFFVFVYLFFGEAIMRTKGNHQIPGLAEVYFGKRGKLVMLIIMILNAYIALIAYMIASGDALVNLFSYFSPAISLFSNPLFFSIIFVVLLSLIIFKGLNIIEDSELLITGFLLLCVVLISFLSFKHIDVQNLVTFSPQKIAMPYGTIFFAFLGFSMIPEAVRIVKKKKKMVKPMLIFAVLVPLFVYVLFSTSIVGVMGPNTNEVGTIGLENVIGPEMILVGNFFLLFAVTTSFLAICFALKDIFTVDYKFSNVLSWFLACVVPFLLFLMVREVAGFIQVLSFGGAVFGGLLALAVLLISYRAKKRGTVKPAFVMPINPWIMGFLYFILLLGLSSIFIPFWV